MERDRQGNVGELSAAEAIPAKRAYTPPRLQRLGSVRELTLGASGEAFDAGGTRMMTLVGM